LNWRVCDLLMIDDVDAGVGALEGRPDCPPHLIEPGTLVGALSDANGRSLMTWLALRRSVWVVGDTANVAAWRTAIAGLLGVPANEIGLVELSALGTV
jgi:hypothetical protein